MASALWLGSMEPQQLTSFLSLPVQVLVTSQSVQPRFAGQRFFAPTGDRKALLSALQDRDIYFLSVADWSPVVLPSRHGRLLALGRLPAAPLHFSPFYRRSSTPPCAGCCRLPNPKPFTSMAVRCAAPLWRRITSPYWKGWAVCESGKILPQSGGTLHQRRHRLRRGLSLRL